MKYCLLHDKLHVVVLDSIFLPRVWPSQPCFFSPPTTSCSHLRWFGCFSIPGKFYIEPEKGRISMFGISPSHKKNMVYSHFPSLSFRTSQFIFVKSQPPAGHLSKFWIFFLASIKKKNTSNKKNLKPTNTNNPGISNPTNNQQSPTPPPLLPSHPVVLWPHPKRQVEVPTAATPRCVSLTTQPSPGDLLGPDGDDKARRRLRWLMCLWKTVWEDVFFGWFLKVLLGYCMMMVYYI